MKHYIKGILLSFLVVFQTIKAQDVSKLTIPNSPAFSILNFEPTAIMRPTNARALAGDILNSFNGEGRLLMNLGLEVSPYWLKSNPDLKRQTYLNPDPGQAFLQSFSLSAATVKDSVTGNNKLGAGFRFRLFNGEPVPQLRTASDALNTRTTVVSIVNGVRSTVGSVINTRAKAVSAITSALTKKNIDQAIISELENEADLIAADYTDAPGDIRQFLDQLITNRVAAYTELSRKVSDLLYQRRGFILEFAGATGFNTTQQNNLERLGIWGNASYYVSSDDLFSLTARYMNHNNRDVDSTLNNFDVGIGYLKKTSSYNISVEGMFRWYKAEATFLGGGNQPVTRSEKDFTYRIAMQGSYVISKDFSINLSFGKDFNAPFITRSGYFSILGFNYSIFSKKPAELQ